MNILVDENLSRRREAALRAEGHRVESGHSLKLRGVGNGRLYRLRRQAGTLPPLRPDDFVAAFMSAFRANDWSRRLPGADSP